MCSWTENFTDNQACQAYDFDSSKTAKWNIDNKDKKLQIIKSKAATKKYASIKTLFAMIATNILLIGKSTDDVVNSNTTSNKTYKRYHKKEPTETV